MVVHQSPMYIVPLHVPLKKTFYFLQKKKNIFKKYTKKSQTFTFPNCRQLVKLKISLNKNFENNYNDGPFYLQNYGLSCNLFISRKFTQLKNIHKRVR